MGMAGESRADGVGMIQVFPWLKVGIIRGVEIIPGLECFPDKPVNAVEIYLETGKYLFNFANIINMQHPCLNTETNKFEDLDGYDLQD